MRTFYKIYDMNFCDCSQAEYNYLITSNKLDNNTVYVVHSDTNKDKITGLYLGKRNLLTDVDSSLSTTSTNPVQNKIITEMLNSLNHSVDNIEKVTEELPEKLDKIEEIDIQPSFGINVEKEQDTSGKVSKTTYSISSNIKKGIGIDVTRSLEDGSIIISNSAPNLVEGVEYQKLEKGKDYEVKFLNNFAMRDLTASQWLDSSYNDLNIRIIPVGEGETFTKCYIKILGNTNVSVGNEIHNAYVGLTTLGEDIYAETTSTNRYEHLMLRHATNWNTQYNGRSSSDVSVEPFRNSEWNMLQNSIVFAIKFLKNDDFRYDGKFYDLSKLNNLTTKYMSTSSDGQVWNFKCLIPSTDTGTGVGTQVSAFRGSFPMYNTTRHNTIVSGHTDSSGKNYGYDVFGYRINSTSENSTTPKAGEYNLALSISSFADGYNATFRYTMGYGNKGVTYVYPAGSEAKELVVSDVIHMYAPTVNIVETGLFYNIDNVQ